ncbi:hypothetical protein [Thalassotalea euphylliae]|uniref:Uncharacterized protein n=1 Tax=Thalassotalea euphylliae TaxID=1655234 RepID=A0A3E0UEU1_9GAMM|nr:hypothetical protein [Thalassotalea euphylliae]REL35077.1 hypothetical protein DXX92_06730 [Thalassotalea euphylliae]
MGQASNKNSKVTPPFLASKLLSLLLPERYSDNVLGDLEEEFYQLAEQDMKLANHWYWRQSMSTSMIYLQKKMRSIEVLGRLNFYLPLAMVLIAISLVSLLSMLTDPEFISPRFWDELLQGKIHTALLSENFWHNFWSFIRMAELDMLIHSESLIIASACLFILSYQAKKPQVSAAKLAIWGYMLAFTPYLWSIIYIGHNSFEARQVGPIIATGILSLFYMLLPVSYLVHRQLKRQQAEQH